MRTLSAGVSTQELQADLHFLTALWQHVQHTAQQVSTPCLVHQEVDLVLRTLRDFLTPEVERVIIDDVEAYERAQAFLQAADLPIWRQTSPSIRRRCRCSRRLALKKKSNAPYNARSG